MQSTPVKALPYWSCCQTACSRQLVIFIVQTLVGIGILSFCLYAVNSSDCNKAAPFWGLIGTVVGFFFRKISLNYTQSNKKTNAISRSECDSQ
jgi:hypothetical protein